MQSHSSPVLNMHEVLQHLVPLHNDFHISASHQSLLSHISSSDIMIAGIEVVPTNPTRAFISDSLVCIPISRLLSVIANLEAGFISNDNSTTYDYIHTAHGVLSACLATPELLCNVDHFWLEMDSAPCDNLSFFAGSSSLIQSDKEVLSMLAGTSRLIEALSNDSHNMVSELKMCFATLTSIRQDLNRLAGKAWHISEIGLMMRSSQPHLKVLLTPNARLSLFDLYELSQINASEVLDLPKLPSSTSSLDAFRNSVHECKLSVSVGSKESHFAIEVKPDFSLSSITPYQDFWRFTSLLFSDIDFDLRERMSDSVVACSCGHARIHSRLHHFKFGVSPSGTRIFKYYRDIRLSERE